MALLSSHSRFNGSTIAPEQQKALRLVAGLCLLLATLGGCSRYSAPAHKVDFHGAPLEMSSLSQNQVSEVDSGILIPDGARDVLHIPGTTPFRVNPAVEEAQELRLKVRELAAQLLETRPTGDLAGLVALPTSFVNLNDFSDSTALGRYMGEAMFFEFDQRGFPTQEYRLPGSITMQEGLGEMALSRKLRPVAIQKKWASVLVGTYHRDAAAIFINARLIRPADGRVLRTAQTILPMNNLLVRMTAKPPAPPKPIFESGTIQVRSSGAATPRKSAPANTATPGDVPGNAPAKAVQSKGIAT